MGASRKNQSQRNQSQSAFRAIRKQKQIMMKQIFCIWDSAAHAFLDPFIAPTIEFALREFRRAVNQPEHQFNQYPEDYILFHIGEFSVEEGKIIPSQPHSLGVGQTFLEQLKIPFGEEKENG